MFKCIANLVVIFVAFALSGCGSMQVKRVDVQSYEIQKQGIETGKAIDRVTSVLIDRGFDIKMANKEMGVVTTEYKKFASAGTSPPFDYYMQVKARVKLDAKGKTVILLSPIVKEQNRTNSAAFTERELNYYTGEPSDVQMISSMREGGWRVSGQVIFNNIVNDVAVAYGVSIEQVIQNVTTTPANAMFAK